MPRTWTADPAFFGTVVAGLRGNPLVQATTADQWFQAVPLAVDRRGNPVGHELAAVEPDDLRDYAGTLTRTRGALTAYGSMMPATSSTPGELARLLDVTPASALDAGARDAYLGAVNRQLDSLRRSVDPVATRTITLAGQTTELPLTITSNADEAIQVRLRLTSSKLAFPDGNERLVTVTDGATQVRVPVEAVAAGQPLRAYRRSRRRWERRSHGRMPTLLPGVLPPGAHPGAELASVRPSGDALVDGWRPSVAAFRLRRRAR